MKSFITSFVAFLAWLAMLLGVGYHADAFLKKTFDYQIREGDAIDITDHREEYPWVIYTRYVDGVEVSWIQTPWLLMSRDHLSNTVTQDGDNQIVRKIERTLQDDFQKSTELLANLMIQNSPPVITTFDITTADSNAVQISYAVVDPATSDYPLNAKISLQNADNSILYSQSFDITSSQQSIYTFDTDFAWCNQELIMTLEVQDDFDRVSISQKITIECSPFNDKITAHIQYLQFQNPITMKYSSRYWSFVKHTEQSTQWNTYISSYYITDRRNIATL